MSTFVVGLGSNLGSRAAMIDAAAALLGASPGLRVGDGSPLYVTGPLGGQGPPYFNAAVRVETDRPAHALLDRSLEVERWLGRVRTGRFSPRTIDLDLLWGDVPVHDPPRLVVPHPGLHERTFALAPLLDVAPELDDVYGEALRALGGPPPVVRGRGVPWEGDIWDRAAEAIGAHLGARTRRRATGPLEVRAFAAPSLGPHDVEGLVAQLPPEARVGWAIDRVALGPMQGGGARIFLVGSPDQR